VVPVGCLLIVAHSALSARDGWLRKPIARLRAG
jgi:hypothetical protein